jgi:hypothetical protein
MSWYQLLDLDAHPAAAHRIIDELNSQALGAVCSVRQSLALAGAVDAAGRLTEICERAPQVFASPYGTQWATAIATAIMTRNLDAFSNALAHLERFDAAAAVLSGCRWLPSETTPSELPIPVTGDVLRIGPSRLGFALTEERDCRLIRSGHFEGVSIDLGDPLLRTRSAQRFTFSSVDNSAAGIGELQAAGLAAQRVAPNLFARYVTAIVPVDSPPGWGTAGTDEGVPGVTYLSFDRDPVDFVAALAHEEAHSLLNGYEAIFGEVLPAGVGSIEVPWRAGLRPLPAVMHGLAAFGRAATVRTRAATIGMSSPQNDEAAEREHGWVRSVSSRVLNGELGPVSENDSGWIQRNVAAIESPARDAKSERLALIASSGPGSSFHWWLLRSEIGGGAAGELYSHLIRCPWSRSTDDFPDQDQNDLTGYLATTTWVSRLFTRDLPAFIGSQRAQAQFQSLRGHKLRTNDRIRMHNDNDQQLYRWRAVLGVTPGELAGGQLSMSPDALPGLSVQPSYGDILLFEIGPTSFHEVSRVLDARPRLTVVASYSRIER